MRFPEDAQRFYAELEQHNSREFWLANKSRFDHSVLQPVRAVADALGDDFGKIVIPRPYRDVRFSADKSPYKTHQGIIASSQVKTMGYCVEIHAQEVLTLVGCYQMTPPYLARYRAAVDDEERGTALLDIIEGLEAEGWILSGDALKTAPRGYAKDHPRIRLLRHRGLFVVNEIVAEDLDGFVEQLVESWQRATPLVAWLTESFHAQNLAEL